MQHHLFPIVRHVIDGAVQQRHDIACSVCDAQDFVSANRTFLPTDMIVAKFKRRGWKIGKNGQHICSTCALLRPHERKALRFVRDQAAAAPSPATDRAIAAIIPLETAPMPVPAAAPAISTASPATARPARQILTMPTAAAAAPAPASQQPAGHGMGIALLYQALVENFDATRGRYRDGWDDAKAADFSGLPLADVIRRREADFGRLTTPSLDIALARTDALDMRAAVSEFTGMATAMTKHIEQARAAIDDLVALRNAMIGRIDWLEASLDRQLERLDEAER